MSAESAYLVDTNVVSELARKAPDARVIAWFGSLERLTISAVTLEELTFGIERVRAPATGGRLRRWFDGLLASEPRVLPVDDRIARLAGNLRAQRERSGSVVAQADMLIAATALAHGLVLVTRNVADFDRCGVTLLNPFR